MKTIEKGMLIAKQRQNETWPPYLQKLAAAQQAMHVNNNDKNTNRLTGVATTNRLAFYAEIRNATQEVIASKNRQEAAILVTYWMYAFSHGLLKSVTPENYLPDIDPVLSMLVQHKLVQSLVMESEHARALASICVARRYCTESDLELPGTEHCLNQVMSQWVGDAQAVTALSSLGNLVHLLYGPGVWELYGSDVTTMRQLAPHLYKLGLPARPHAGSEHAISTCIPNDLPSNLI